MIKVKNIYLSYRYKNLNYEILKDINLSIQNDDFILLKGPSGSGKTSFLKLLAGFIDQTSGEINIDDSSILPQIKNPIKKLNKFRTQLISFIFQDFKLLPKYTILENLLLPFKFSSVKQKDQKTLIFNLLKQFHLESKSIFYPPFLSGGEIQKISIIRGLLKRPRLIIADEPFSNLDQKSTQDILDTFINLYKTKNIAFIISTHHIDLSYLDKKINYKLYHLNNQGLKKVHHYE